MRLPIKKLNQAIEMQTSSIAIARLLLVCDDETIVVCCLCMFCDGVTA